jgi:hypothetical protein
MSKYRGNVVTPTPAPMSGTRYTGKANGRFSLSEQSQAKQSSLWAKTYSVPDPPVLGTVTGGNAFARIPFTAPDDNGGYSITNYTVTSSPGGNSVSGISSPLTLTGLTNGVTYTFTMTATNQLGTSVPSSASNSYTPTNISAPDAPTITSASATSDTTAVITFAAPSYNGNSVITSYTGTCSNGATITLNQSGSGTMTFTGLTTGQSYTFTVTATNAIGTSNPSPTSPSVLMVVLGASFGGGFYAGKINDNGTLYHLILSPKATGEIVTEPYGPTTYYNTLNQTNGYANTVTQAAQGTNRVAATFCKNLTIGGYNDWYVPSLFELESLYYYFKPTTTANNTYLTTINGSLNPTTGNWDGIPNGYNPAAVSPRSTTTAYTASSPAQTYLSSFQLGNSEAFVSGFYFSSSENEHPPVSTYATNEMHVRSFNTGEATTGYKTITSWRIRAVRRIPV